MKVMVERSNTDADDFRANLVRYTFHTEDVTVLEARLYFRVPLEAEGRVEVHELYEDIGNRLSEWNQRAEALMRREVSDGSNEDHGEEAGRT